MDSTLLGALITAVAAIIAALIAKPWKLRRRSSTRGKRGGESRAPSSESSDKLQINYKYNSVGCPVAAKAYLNGRYMIGEAYMVRLNKGLNLQVKETHYSLSGDGSVAYEGLVSFGIPGGLKLSETAGRGCRGIDIFRTWPI